MTRLHWLLILLALAGAVVSTFSLITHYSSSSTFCNFGDAFNCDIVNRGLYSEVLGIPVAGIGLAGYLALAGLAFWHARRPSRDAHTLLLAAALAGLAFSLYLTGLEAFVIHVWCPLCLASQGIIIAITVVAFALRRPSPMPHA